jgi:hypothetical protein
MTEICILEFPTNLGLHEPAPGMEPGVKKAGCYALFFLDGIPILQDLPSRAPVARPVWIWPL